MKFLEYFLHPNINGSNLRIFDEIGDGFISVEKFKFILKEIDEDFTDEELEEVILEVKWLTYVDFFFKNFILKVDLDKSTTIDFNEFVKIMTF